MTPWDLGVVRGSRGKKGKGISGKINGDEAKGKVLGNVNTCVGKEKSIHEKGNILGLKWVKWLKYNWK
jgi:hypothetical protein